MDVRMIVESQNNGRQNDLGRIMRGKERRCQNDDGRIIMGRMIVESQNNGRQNDEGRIMRWGREEVSE